MGRRRRLLPRPKAGRRSFRARAAWDLRHEPIQRREQRRVPGANRGSPIPILTALLLHSDAVRITHLDPDRAWSRSIGAVDPLRDDSLGTKPASVLEHCGVILGDVFVEQDARPGIAQQPRELGLAVEEGAITQILAVVLDQVEGVEDRGPARRPFGPDPRTTTSRQAREQPPRRRWWTVRDNKSG